MRNIIYLDESKLYSISSQALEGLTEYLLTESTRAAEEQSSQKGPVASGRLLADALTRSETSIARRILHDHALAMLEQKLEESNSVVTVSPENADDIAASPNSTFVRIVSPATFFDGSKINELLKIFNSLGESLAYVTNSETIKAANEALEAAKAHNKDKNKLALLQRQLSPATDAVQLAKAGGLYQDPKFLHHLSCLTEFAFEGHLEVQQFLSNTMFSAPLRREYLREPESLLIRKYSRRTEKQFVVFGVMAQTSSAPSDPLTPNANSSTPTNMRHAVTNLINHIAGMESTLTGKISGEALIDPIAVYLAV